MSVLAPLGILIISMLIMAFLSLTPGVFALLNHYAYGKYSRKKAEHLTFFFILGAETTSSCLFLSVYIIVSLFISNSAHLNLITWLLIGIIISLSFISLFFYYRPGRGTRLFISRRVAKSIDQHARAIKTRSDAFTLGALSGAPELLFTLPLYIITSAEILHMSSTRPSSVLLTILYILAPTIPLFIMRWQFHRGRNLADITRSRIRDKNFIRFILTLSYALIATLIICLRT